LKEDDLRLVCQKWGVSVKGLRDGNVGHALADFVGNALNAMLRHAVDAAQVATVGKRYTQIVDLSSLTIFHGVSFLVIVACGLSRWA